MIELHEATKIASAGPGMGAWSEARILAFATKGAGSNEETRLRALLEHHPVDFFAFDRAHKWKSFRRLMRQIRDDRPELVVMEGTGIAGGIACILSKKLRGIRYVVSSGDAVGPWVSMRVRPLGWLFTMYEKTLCRGASGFIGWTPYLVGRALSFGAKRAMTAAGWAEFELSTEAANAARCRTRQALGIAPDAIVFGIVGSLVWTPRVRYSYGAELVRAIQRISRPDVAVLIAGGGSGHDALMQLAGDDLGRRIFLPGQIAPDRVPEYLAAMDVASLPQSVDAVGSFRYTTKISEYIAARLPIVTSQIPLSYDFPHDWMWRLPGDAPWDERSISALAALMESVTVEQIESKKRAIPAMPAEFDRARQVARATEFISDILQARPCARAGATRARVAVPAPRRLLSVAHSYVVAMNRRLVHEMHRQSNGRWEVCAVAPSYFHGAQDLRPLHFEPLPNENCPVEVVPAHLTRYVHVFSYGRKLKRVLRDGGWDFVHAWEEPYIWVGGQIARWAPKDVPLVYRTAQSLDKHYPPPFNWIERHNMRRASGWICSGTLVANVLGARPIYQRRPMRLIPLGVDLEAFRVDRASAEPVFRKLNWQRNGPPIIGYLGRFIEAKGLSLLMAVLGDLKTPWRAMLVGAGPLEGRIREWARRFNDDRVRICTDVRHKDVPAYLNAMEMLVAPSQTTPNWREQFGRMLIEAFASGVPVIGSDSGEIPHVIDDAGVIVGERDRIGWGKALADLLDSPKRREELAQRGLARASDYSWPVIARRHLEFFDEILESRSGR